MKTYPLRLDQDIIFKYLDTVEGMYNNDAEFDRHDIEDYAIAAIISHKKYGRSKHVVQQILDDIGGIDMWTLEEAGITYEDYNSIFIHE